MIVASHMKEARVMSWSWKLGRIAGIDVFVHATFVILLAWVALVEYLPSGSVTAAADGVLFILAVFGVVVLHELGHALTARRFGIPTRDITLLPIGGVARLERMPENPMQELLVALAGPAVNLALAGGLYGVLLAVGASPFDRLSMMEGGFLGRLFWVNVTLALFNLLPAFPMDGGRVLRALLAFRMDRVQATTIAARTGQAMALLFGFIGLFSNPFLVFIALFVWMGATQEAAATQLRGVLDGVPVGRVMVRELRTLAPQDPLNRAVDAVLAGFQQDFPVADMEGRLLGVLTRADLIQALSARGPDAPVADAMRRDYVTAEESEPVSTALGRLEECRCHTLPVTNRGRVVGVLTMDNLGEYVLVQNALRQRLASA
jgi:Zn-dependent protease/CBS domain-containing protein